MSSEHRLYVRHTTKFLIYDKLGRYSKVHGLVEFKLEIKFVTNCWMSTVHSMWQTIQRCLLVVKVYAQVFI
jgi:hypothetical protein